MATSPSRHEKHKAATRHSLFAAVRELIAEKGYSDVDILDITERADVSKATFYQHFPNKEDCVRQLMVEGFDALVESLFVGARTAPSPDDWALYAFQEGFRWGEDNRNLLLVMVGGAASSQLNAFGRKYTAAAFERAIREFGLGRLGHRHPVPVRAQVISGVVVQLMGWWLENDTGYSAEEMAALVVDVLEHGLGSA